MSKPTQSLMTSDVGTLWVGEGFPWFFKCPVVGPPCDLTRILGDVIVYVIGRLSRGNVLDRDMKTSLKMTITQNQSLTDLGSMTEGRASNKMLASSCERPATDNFQCRVADRV